MVEGQLNLISGWTCFDVAAQRPMLATASRHAGVAVLSACLCTDAALQAPRNQAGGLKVHLGYAPTQARPSIGPAFFLVPAAPSRSGTEPIGQKAAIVAVHADGHLEAYFERGTTPPVLHLSLCFSVGGTPLQLDDFNNDLIMCPSRPLKVHASGAFAVLEGELDLAEFSGSVRVGTLPALCRPRRDLRFLGLLRGEEQSRPIVQTIAVTLRTDGSVVVQGSSTVKVDDSGNGKRLNVPKKGRLFFDGLRFALREGRPILVLVGGDRDRTPSPKRCSSEDPGDGHSGRATPSTETPSNADEAPRGDIRSRLGLQSLTGHPSPGNAARPAAHAVCVVDDGVVLLEGHISLQAGGGLAEPRLPVARLPAGCWPRCRMTFLTRGPGNLVERCRVDVDQQGRVFCPEGADSRIELTGIVFVAADSTDVGVPHGSEFDDLLESLPLKVPECKPQHVEYEGRDELLEHMSSMQAFQWRELTDALAIRDPDFLSTVGLWRNWTPRLPRADFEFSRTCPKEGRRIWFICGEDLKASFGITSFETLLYISDEMLRHIGIYDFHESLACPHCSSDSTLKDEGTPDTGWMCDGTASEPCGFITDFHQTTGYRCYTCESCGGTFCKLCLTAMKDERNRARFKIPPVDLKWLWRQRAAARRSAEQGVPQPSVTRALADEVAGQLLAQWDVPGQLRAAVRKERRPVEALRRMLPCEESSLDREMRKHFRPDEMARYEEVQQFFKRYETGSCNETHTSLKGSADKFTSTGKWHFPDEHDIQDVLFDNLAWLYEHDWMCYISEKQSIGFPFIEDIDVQCQGTMRDAPPDDLIMNCTREAIPSGCSVSSPGGDPGAFMRRRARCIHQFYPDLSVLNVHVYTASGWHKEKKLWKSSFHFVWPQLIVDAHRAPVIRLATLHDFSEETEQGESFLSQLFLDLNAMDPKKDPNARRVTAYMLWEDVFDKTTVHGGNGLRMPYNDKIRKKISDEDNELIATGGLTKADARRRAPWEQERRPSVAVGTIRFVFESDGTLDARWVEDQHAWTVKEWLWRGSCRRPGSPDLTPWRIPAEVASWLPMRPGERQEMADDGTMIAMKPIPQVRRFLGSTEDFRRQMRIVLENVVSRQRELTASTRSVEIQRGCSRVKLVVSNGTWRVTQSQAEWNSNGACQIWSRALRPNWASLGREESLRVKRRQNPASKGHIPGLDPDVRHVRPSQIVYSCAHGKVLVDGPRDIVDAILEELKKFTEPDDADMMPTYDSDRIRFGVP